MLNTDKVRGIMRAKQGSQISKFNTGGWLDWFLQQNQYNQGSTIPTTETGPNGKIMGGSLDWQNATDEERQYATLTPEVKSIKDAKIKMAAEKKLQNVQNFFKKNGQTLFNAGLDFIGNKFDDTEDSKVVDGIFQVGDTIGQYIPQVKMINLALKGVNSLLGSRTDEFSADKATIEQVGSSYGGSVKDISNAVSKADKKYGLFSGRKRREANDQIADARRQQNIMAGIANGARDMQAMTGNDFNYLNYDFNLSGGYDQRYMRAAKSGMKLQDKINFVKQRGITTGIINVDTKEIDWEPEVIIFKTGGLIESDYDIIYEIPKVEEFKDGGKTKEELETPEIEETTQKNLIPEGALHKNKHHMEHTEGLTQKGIPVIDNDGEQQAEIELDEIIFTLEVTKKLEELYKEGTDEAAIEAGKLLVKEILFNTDDRTGLIAKCEKGGKL